jgi:ubiquinone/menaquinone biosynthesis C-methylase UbiE
MSVDTIEVRERTVETFVERLVEDLGGTIGVLTLEVGARAGFWEALAGAGPTTAQELSERTGAAGPLVREWLRAQAAAGYLDHDPETDRFTLSDEAAGALVYGPGLGMVTGCVEMLGPMVGGLDRYVAALRRGDGVGWHELGAQYWHGADVLTQVSLPSPVIGSVLEAAGVIERLSGGGTVLDVACGYGTPTLGMAEHLPATTIVGIDYNSGSVEEAERRAATAGVSDRVRFIRATATEPPPVDGGYDLVTFVDSLHDMGDPVGALSAARRVLAPGGRVLLLEFAATDDVADNLHPMGRLFYGVSTLICTANAVSQQVNGTEPLGTLAGPAALSEVARQAGFAEVRLIPTETQMNLVLELR